MSVLTGFRRIWQALWLWRQPWEEGRIDWQTAWDVAGTIVVLQRKDGGLRP